MICPRCAIELTSGIAFVPIIAITPIDIPAVAPVSKLVEVMKCLGCGYSLIYFG
jgi:hypothetical protein